MDDAAITAPPAPRKSIRAQHRRDRTSILAALLALSAIAWLYLVSIRQDMAGMDMQSMPGMTMPMAMAAPWTGSIFALTFIMWWVMMLGMMLPSAAPMILTFATLNRSKRVSGQTFVPTSVFVSGYLIVWGGFSLAATTAQWELDRLALLSPAMATNTMLGGGLLMLAGIYQFTPLKETCLRQCRSPFAFVLNHWRDGRGGALRMGLEHGAWCLGCCGFLMALLFVVGVMNLLWVAGIAVFVLAEKLFPGGVWIGRIGGGVMLACGLWLTVAQ